MKEEKEKISWNDKIINSVSNNIVWIFLVFIIVVIIIPNLFARLTLFPFIKDDGKEGKCYRCLGCSYPQSRL